MPTKDPGWELELCPWRYVPSICSVPMQSSSGSVGKSIWLEFTSTKFESRLDLNAFFLYLIKTSILTVDITSYSTRTQQFIWWKLHKLWCNTLLLVVQFISWYSSLIVMVHTPHLAVHTTAVHLAVHTTAVHLAVHTTAVHPAVHTTAVHLAVNTTAVHLAVNTTAVHLVTHTTAVHLTE